MSHPRAGWVLAGATLAICALAGGCQSTSSFGGLLARHGPAASDKANRPVVLAQGMEVEWHIKPEKAAPNQILSGHSVVGPDGKIEMGPYGPCAVAGMTVPKAATALEKHLAWYIHGPTVTLTTQAPIPNSSDVAWRQADGSAPASGLANSGKKDNRFFAVGFLQQKEGTNPPAIDKDKKDLDFPPAPPALVHDPKALQNYAGLPGSPVMIAPNECNPILLPSYVIGPTDVLQIESLKGLKTQPVFGPHLVGPDGSVRVGVYGAVPVAGLTLEQARLAIAQTVHARLNDEVVKLKDVLESLSVDVLAYNSKTFYIIMDGGGQGEQLISLPVTGNDTVLNAMAKVNGLPAAASKYRIWVARATCPGCAETILPVDWIGITQRGAAGSNWQIMPGDRIYVHSDPWIRANTTLAKVLAPFERILGVTLLGSQTVNSIKSGSVGGTR